MHPRTPTLELEVHSDVDVCGLLFTGDNEFGSETNKPVTVRTPKAMRFTMMVLLETQIR